MSGGSNDSSGSTTPQATPEQMMNMYQQYLPAAMATATNQVVPTANTLAGAASGANPTYTASGLSQLQNYAPGYQAAGADISAQQAASQNALIQGAGGDTARSAAALTNSLNPALASANTGAASAVNAINLNGLSPGEYNSTERALNQTNQGTGNLGLMNNTNAINNAMNFGGAFNNKIGLMNSTTANAANVGSAMNNAINPTSVATNAGNTSNNFGLSTYNPTQANSTLTTPYSFASSFGNQLAGVSAASTGTTSSGGASGGCFLTTVCCQHKGLPDNCEELTILRAFRDSHVPKGLVKEYYRIAPTIVSKIKDNPKQLDGIYEVVKQCVEAIKMGYNTLAIEIYQDMVKQLQKD